MAAAVLCACAAARVDCAAFGASAPLLHFLLLLLAVAVVLQLVVLLVLPVVLLLLVMLVLVVLVLPVVLLLLLLLVLPLVLLLLLVGAGCARGGAARGAMRHRFRSKSVFSLSLNVAPPLLPYVRNLVKKKECCCTPW